MVHDLDILLEFVKDPVLRLEAQDRVLHELEEDVEVVDHEVEDDAYVLRAERGRRDPIGDDVARVLDEALGRAERRVEPLDVADLEDGAARARRLHQDRRVGDGRGDRLLDEDVLPRLDEGKRDLAVRPRRDDDRDRVHAVDHVAPALEGADAEPRPHLEAALRVGVGDGHELDARERAVDPSVVLAEVADPDDPDSHGPTLMSTAGGGPSRGRG